MVIMNESNQVVLDLSAPEVSFGEMPKEDPGVNNKIDLSSMIEELGLVTATAHSTENFAIQELQQKLQQSEEAREKLQVTVTKVFVS
jgi:hypothetical protein